MKGKKRLILAIAAIGLAAVVWLSESRQQTRPGCTDPLGCVEIGPQAPVNIGVIQSLSGEVALLGLEQMRGLELALEMRDHALLGHAVALEVEDTGCRAEGGAIAALKIVSNPSTVAIFGTTCSADAASAAEVMAEAGLAMISGNNSAPFLTSIAGKQAPHWQPGYFRTAGNEEHAGPAAARYAYQELGIRQAVTINDGDIYTKGLTDGFRAEFERQGGRIIRNATINKGDRDMGPVLQAAVQARAQLIFFPLFQPEGNQLLLQARRMPELQDVVLMSDGSLIEKSFLDDVGEAARGMYFVGPAPPERSETVEALKRRYVQRFGQEPATIYYLSAFDAVSILLEAIERTAVKRSDGSLSLGRQALRRALYETRDFPGVGGRLTCNAFGDCGLARFNVLQLIEPAQGVEGLQANVKYTYAP